MSPPRYSPGSALSLRGVERRSNLNPDSSPCLPLPPLRGHPATPPYIIRVSRAQSPAKKTVSRNFTSFVATLRIFCLATMPSRLEKWVSLRRRLLGHGVPSQPYSYYAYKINTTQAAYLIQQSMVCYLAQSPSVLQVQYQQSLIHQIQTYLIVFVHCIHHDPYL